MDFQGTCFVLSSGMNAQFISVYFLDGCHFFGKDLIFLAFKCSICFVRFSYSYLSGELRTVHHPFSGYLWETVSKIQSREYQNCKVLVQLSVRYNNTHFIKKNRQLQSVYIPTRK